MKFTLELADLAYVIGVVFSFAAGYFALKWQMKTNKQKSEETYGSLEKFKTFVYTELKDIDKTLTDIRDDLHDMLAKEDAAKTYVTKEAHGLVMKNIDLQLATIVEKLDEIKDK